MRHVQPDDPGERPARDHDVVERGERRRPASGRPGRICAGQAPSARGSRTRPPAASRASPRARSASAFDRKPTLPRLMPEIGTSTSATAWAARRNVPSPPSTTRASVPAQLARASRPSRRPARPTARRRGSGTSRPPARCSSTRVLDGGVVREADPRRRSRRRPPRRASTARVDQRARCPRTTGPAARWTRNSRLPSGPWIGDGMTPRVPRPELPAARGHGLAQHAAMDRRVAHDAALRVGRRPRTAASRGRRSAPAVAQHGADRRRARGRAR